MTDAIVKTVKTVSAETVADFKAAWKAEESANKAAANATEKARTLARDIVKEFGLEKSKALATDTSAAIKAACDAAIAGGLKVDVTTRDYSNFRSYVSDFCMCYARPTTPVETVKQDKEKTKVIKPASEAADKSIKEARQAARAIREGEGASGNNKTGANGKKPAAATPAPVISALSRPLPSFADIEAKLEQMLQDKDQFRILNGWLKSHGYSLTPIKAAAKPAAKAEPKKTPAPALPTVAETLAPAVKS